MLGKIISIAIKVVTLPVDIVNAAADVGIGGDGSKKSRNDPDFPNPLSALEKVRDAAADAAAEIDD